MQNPQKLFSYGTLQFEEVQLATFNRILNGSPDILVGYKLSNLSITNPDVVAKSGEAVHPVVIYTGDANDEVAGYVFEISMQELLNADEYEDSDYRRVEASLKSGAMVWLYREK